MSRARGTFRVHGRHARGLPAVRADRLPHRVVGRHGRADLAVRPGHGRDRRRTTSSTSPSFPASHYVASEDRMKRRRRHDRGGAARAARRARGARASCSRPSGCGCGPAYDLEMLREVGFCSGIENYSRHIDGRSAGTAPYTLLDYFPDDYLVVIDESHVTVPQLARHVRGRPLAQVHARRVRVPAAERDRQPAAAVRGVHASGRSRSCTCSATPGAYELRVSSTRGRADRPADRARRPRGRRSGPRRDRSTT